MSGKQANVSAFDRLPRDYRVLCERIAKAWTLPRAVRPLSAQNRNVRFAADMALAGRKSFPNTVTRQQRRWAYRRGRWMPA